MRVIEGEMNLTEKTRKNNWQSIWANRLANVDILQGKDKKEILLELKRSSGYDVMPGSVSLESFITQYLEIKNGLFFAPESKEKLLIESIYEVGCGSGGNLYMFENDIFENEEAGIQCGGIDYSENLLHVAQLVLSTTDLTYDEAIFVDTEKKYDAVFSNGVFSYFQDEAYGYSVLEKMYEKARKSIGILEIHDIEKKDDYISYRKRNIENYEEKYKNLPRLFYSKQFFVDFAKEHNLLIKFTDSKMEGYWNNEFIFNCYMYK